MYRTTRYVCAAMLALHIFSVAAASGKPEGERRPKIGLVLSGGGARGIAHVGVIKVLEEAGIGVDYIAGTSMGSIVGAMYAIGYDAATLEKLALTMDWNDILDDRVSHRHLSMQEKLGDGRYAFSFPLRNGQVSLPSGYIPGQKLAMELARLTLPVHNVRDFNTFIIPFICVATDIETGKAKVFDRGYLPDALRASMAIPSIFIPVEIDGHLYADGGIVLNFPVSETRARGADIIIGVDVQTPLYRKDELNSLARIMEQSVYFLGEISNERERALCDTLITPDVSGFTASSFENPGELIRRGEEAARAKLPEIIALLKSAPTGRTAPTVPLASRDEKRFITAIRIRGLDKVSKNLVRGALGLKTPAMMSYEDIESAIDRVYGTMFFERVEYRLEPAPPGERLVVRVKESTTNWFKVGIHYDSDSNAALLLNTTFRNIAGEGSKLSIDLNLSENPMMETSYIIQTGLRPGIGAGLIFWYSQYDVFIYQNTELVADLDYRTFGGDFMLFTTFSNPFALGAAIQKQYIKIEKKIAPPDWEGGSMDFLNYYAFMMLDTLDRVVFTRSGLFLYLEAMRIGMGSGAEEKTLYHPVYKYSAQVSTALPVHRRFTIQLGAYGGSIRGHTVYAPHLFYMGSVYSNARGVYPFMGLHYMEVSGRHMAVAYGALQLEPWRDIFVALKANAGKMTERREDLENADDLLLGYGLSLGALSVIGPLEFTVAKGAGKDEIILHVNIGYRF
ncbi:MAG: patatin-like phospholipase family protein [Spirochaetota bacterium]